LIAIKTITLVGTGNVATHLGKSLFNKGFRINEVYSKSKKNATILAEQLDSDSCDNISQLKPDSDVYIICIKDGFIENVASQFTFTNKIIAHTSGSIGIKALGRFNNCGIFYPLQTFSKEKEVKITEVPFCIEASNTGTEKALLTLAKSLSKSVQLVSSEQRKKIHLAAVFACNFSNYMYTISENILNKNNIDFEILKPLIIETSKKISNNSPKSMQTGPAKRNDDEVIKNHIEMLADSKDYQDIYKLITENIIKNN
jgi:predicted short-subunit dehydrogenase-like oxidoreductase (DUF2520 family)